MEQKFHRNSTVITDLLKNPFKRQKKEEKKKKKKKKKKKREKKEEKKQQKQQKDFLPLGMLKENIRINLPFYIISIICLYFLAKKTKQNFIFTMISLLLLVVGDILYIGALTRFHGRNFIPNRIIFSLEIHIQTK